MLAAVKICFKPGTFHLLSVGRDYFFTYYEAFFYGLLTTWIRALSFLEPSSERDSEFARNLGLFISSKEFPSEARSVADMPASTASDVGELMFNFQIKNRDITSFGF